MLLDEDVTIPAMLDRARPDPKRTTGRLQSDREPPLLLALGIGPLLRWKRDAPARTFRLLGPVLVASVALGAGLWLSAWRGSLMVAVALFFAAWVALSTAQAVATRLRNRSGLLRALAGLPRGFVGMVTAHVGVSVFIVGVTLTSAFDVERDVRLAPGDTATLAGYGFTFEGVSRHRGPNYVAERGRVRLSRDGEELAVLGPEKRRYPTQEQPMTEAAIDVGFTRDLYVALGEPIGEEGAWSLRLYHKPFVRWIWLGALLMSLGGLIAASDRRYRVIGRARSPERGAAAPLAGQAAA